MANSHPGSYCGQDAYNDMFVTERRNERICTSEIRAVQGIESGKQFEAKRLQGCNGSNCNRVGDEINTNVRRLTELECERLQGFPDGWTEIGEWDEEKQEHYYIDSYGKRKRVTSSARYKALGNSICTPFWQWLARRICAQYEREITMGSLFDGIGGFPYVFEKCGAKAVWASEIEEFPIAVTEEHFPE